MDLPNSTSVDEEVRFNSLYSSLFDFEGKFSAPTHIKWVTDHWYLPTCYSVVYVVFIFGATNYMQTRTKFSLRPCLALWSGCMAIFSIMGSVRMLPEFIDSLFTQGFKYSVCSVSYIHYAPTSFWSYAFGLSKAYELGDTVFVILRKQPLIFLHWYHHITVMLYCWYSYIDLIGGGRWFIVLNFVVHAVMYSYYTLKAMQIKVPRIVSMFITIMQLSQMIVGLVVNLYAYYLVQNGVECQQTFHNFLYSILMYTSYVILFANYFYHAYMAKKTHAKPEKLIAEPAMNGHAKNHYKGE